MSKVIVFYAKPQALKLSVKGQTVVINGSRQKGQHTADGKPVLAGYGQTEMDLSLWEAIKQEYASAEFLRRGEMFVRVPEKKTAKTNKDSKTESGK